MRRALLSLTALGLAISYGVAEGVWTGRWFPSDELDRAAARVAGVPRTIGEWEGTDRELDAREVAMAKLEGYVARTYTHHRTGETVSVMLLCGRPGPIGAHTPDVCFQGNGAVMIGSPQQEAFPAAGLPAPAEFWTARFEQPGPAGGAMSALWAWSADGCWIASGNPRLEFARSAALYKLYVIRPAGARERGPADDPILAEFLAAFLPATQAALFPTDPAPHPAN